MFENTKHKTIGRLQRYAVLLNSSLVEVYGHLAKRDGVIHEVACGNATEYGRGGGGELCQPSTVIKDDDLRLRHLEAEARHLSPNWFTFPQLILFVRPSLGWCLLCISFLFVLGFQS
jgi:hypothetical protein